MNKNLLEEALKLEKAWEQKLEEIWQSSNQFRDKSGKPLLRASLLDGQRLNNERKVN